MRLDELIQKQDTLSAGELIRASFDIFKPDIIATSSFGATAGVLIHLVASLNLPIRIVYINPGFLFKETLEYIKQLKNIYTSLEFVELRPEMDTGRFLQKYGADVFVKNPELCCRMNKVEPLDRYLNEKKIKAWLSGLRNDQTEFRKNLSKVTLLKNGIYKIAPILSWTSREVHDYMKTNKIPFHPLYEKGYTSIGCEPCTGLPSGEDERSGRWKGQTKNECGLHTKI